MTATEDAPTPAPRQTSDRNTKVAAQKAQTGALGRLGLWTATHRRWVFAVWALLVIGLGAAAPSVFSSLAGAGWQANGSESVAVGDLAQEHFGGASSAAVQVVIHSDHHEISSPQVQRVISEITDVAKTDSRFGSVVAPQPGMTISQDGHTGVALIGANASTGDMVKAVDDHKEPLTALGTDDIKVYPTGASALWSDFNKANHEAMIKAEMFSWPITLAITVVAFGSLVAAGLPLLLTIAGLVASAGGLVLLNALTPISVWATNFAMMFALALGIDYALFMVSRFRAAMTLHDTPQRATAETMNTAGKAVLLSGITVLISLSAVLLVPAPAVRTMAVGIMLAVVFVLAATMTLLPATLAATGRKVNAAALPWAKKQQHRSPLFEKWGHLLHRHPWPFAVVSLALLILLTLPVLGLKVAMPSINVVPEDAPVRQGYHVVAEIWVREPRAHYRSSPPSPMPMPPQPQLPQRPASRWSPRRSTLPTVPITLCSKPFHRWTHPMRR